MQEQTYVILFYGIVGLSIFLLIISTVFFVLIRRYYRSKFNVLADRLIASTHQEEIEKAMTKEHDRISQIIHDEIGNKLIALLYEFERHFQQGTFGMGGSDMLWQLTRQLKERVRDTRALVREFSSSELNSSGIVTELEHFCKSKNGFHGVSITLAGVSGARRFELKREKELVSMVKELVYNSLKYSGCWHIDVGLTWEANSLTIEVSDDGYGILESDLNKYKQSGLAGMRKRCQAIDARLKIEQPLKGSSIQITLPI